MARCLPFLVEDVFVHKHMDGIRRVRDSEVLVALFGALGAQIDDVYHSGVRPELAVVSKAPMFSYEALMERLEESGWGR